MQEALSGIVDAGAAPGMIAGAQRRRVKVRRDMELVRKILLAIEAKGDREPSEIHIPDEDAQRVAWHVEMLHHAGMIVGDRAEDLDERTIMVCDLTWAGHDLAGALRNETVWRQLKAKLGAADLATLPISVLKGALVKLAEQWAMSKLGF